MYFVTNTTSNLGYSISYEWEFLAVPSKSYIKAAKHHFRYTEGTTDLNLSFSHSEAWEITLDGYSDSDYRKCLDNRQNIYRDLLRLTP
jgi:hypothetical protein